MTQQFWDHQFALKGLYNDYIHAACKRFQLTKAEMDILLFLSNNPQFDRATDIVEHRGLSKSHVSTSLRSLEDKGFLHSSCLDRDRRTLHLQIRESAAPAIEAGQAAQTAFFQTILQDFTDEEKDALRHLLKRIAANALTAYRKDEIKDGDTL